MQPSTVRTEAQLELSLENPSEPEIEAGLPEFPALELSEETTPAAILAWWDQLVEIFSRESDLAQPRLQSLRAENATAKSERTKEARGRIRRLRAEEEQILARIEAVEIEAYGLFEGTLSEFSPRLIRLFQAEGLDVPDDDEMAVAEFWDCLHRPAIEWCAQIPIREIARHFCQMQGR